MVIVKASEYKYYLYHSYLNFMHFCTSFFIHILDIRVYQKTYIIWVNFIGFGYTKQGGIFKNIILIRFGGRKWPQKMGSTLWRVKKICSNIYHVGTLNLCHEILGWENIQKNLNPFDLEKKFLAYFGRFLSPGSQDQKKKILLYSASPDTSVECPHDILLRIFFDLLECFWRPFLTTKLEYF